MKKLKKVLILMLVLTMVLSLLTACGGEEDVTKEEGEVTEKQNDEEKEGSSGPKVSYISGMSTETLNAHISDSTSESDVYRLIYGNLLDLIYDKETDNIKFVPWHAKEIPTVNDEGKIWTFKLRDDVKFTDGTPIDAHTYEYSWKMLLDPKLVNRNANTLFEDLKIVKAEEYFKGKADWEEVGIKVLDDYTIQITLEKELPEIDVLTSFARAGSTSPVHKEMYEAGMNEDRTETKYATSLENTPCCGSYKLVDWVRDQSKVYEKNPDDIMAANVYVPDRIEERVISQNSTRIQLFEKGEMDSVSVTGDDYDRYAEDPRIVFAEANGVWGFYINGESKKNPILQNNDLRKALFYGINRDSISKGVFRVYASSPYFISTQCMVGDWREGQRYRDTEEGKSAIPEDSGYEPEKAKEYFDKAYKANENKKIEIELIYFEEQESMKRMAEVAEEEYENLFGKDKLDIKLRATPPSAAYEAYENGDYDMGIGAMTQNPFNAWQSMTVWTSTFPQKIDTFKNKEFDELQKRTTTGDLISKPEERLKALARMEELLVDYVPQIPIFQNDNAVMYQDHIRLLTDGKYFPEIGFASKQAERLH